MSETRNNQIYRRNLSCDLDITNDFNHTLLNQATNITCVDAMMMSDPPGCWNDAHQRMALDKSEWANTHFQPKGIDIKNIQNYHNHNIPLNSKLLIVI